MLSFRPDATWSTIDVVSFTSFCALPDPYILMESTAVRGFATCSATLGMMSM